MKEKKVLKVILIALVIIILWGIWVISRNLVSAGSSLNEEKVEQNVEKPKIEDIKQKTAGIRDNPIYEGTKEEVAIQATLGFLEDGYPCDVKNIDYSITSLSNGELLVALAIPNSDNIYVTCNNIDGYPYKVQKNSDFSDKEKKFFSTFNGYFYDEKGVYYWEAK